MRLTSATIRTAKPPRGRADHVYFDDDLPGFGLRVRASGAKAFLVQYAIAGRTRRMTLGTPAVLDVSKARSLAIMAPARNKIFPDVPTLKESMGIDYATGAWRGIAGPKGLPADVATKLTASLKKVFDSAEFKEFMSNRGFGTVWGNAAEFAAFMDKGDAQMGDAMKAAGLSKA